MKVWDLVTLPIYWVFQMPFYIRSLRVPKESNVEYLPCGQRVKITNNVKKSKVVHFIENESDGTVPNFLIG